MATVQKCPVCGKRLTQAEYDKALGLWKDKQEHIRHLEAERRSLKKKELRFRREAERRDRNPRSEKRS